MTKRARQRAVFLISMLFFSVLIIMFAEAALSLAPSALSRSSADLRLIGAEHAAKSGIDWARVRISSDPTWRAENPQTFTYPGLTVTEGDGQVVGWLQQGSGWSRFRIRFNYQDGVAAALPNSDNMNDPTTPWTDFAYLSSNNLLSGAAGVLPYAASGSSYSNSGPWPTPQLQIPSNTLVLSVEGVSGPVRMSAGNPVAFYGSIQKRVIQTCMKFSNNQPITDAAISSGTDLDLSTYGSQPAQLNSVGSETARLRAKQNMKVGDMTSSNGELRGTTITNGALTGITKKPEGSDGLYKIPFSKVRVPSSGNTLNAGVYVVLDNGTVQYYNMDYGVFATTSPRPPGTVVTLPAGLTLVGPNASGPKYRIEVTGDLRVVPNGPVKDFALIPDGGAPQSTAYIGSPATTTPTTPPPAGPIDAGPFLTSINPSGSVGMSIGRGLAWAAVLDEIPGVAVSTAGLTITYSFSGKSVTLGIGYGTFATDLATLTTALNAVASSDPTKVQNLMGSYGYTPPATTPPATGPVTTPPPTPPTALPGGTLSPADLELTLKGGTQGLTIANNDGNIVIGAQVQGNGSALVAKKDIALIGTSTELSSSPGAALGLNLYAQGNITIDAYRLDSSGATFKGVNLKGVLYSWHDVNILAGNSTTSAPFAMTGTMVAYGGDPAVDNPGAYPANVKIHASTAAITFDPSYVANLVQGGPFSLKVVSWHDF